MTNFDMLNADILAALTSGLVLDNDAFDNDLSEKVGFLINSTFLVEIVIIAEYDADDNVTNTAVLEITELKSAEMRNLSHIADYDADNVKRHELYRCKSFAEAMRNVTTAIQMSYDADPDV